MHSLIQEIQAAHRRRIVEAWGLSPGLKVLELGCGQGDMTAVLAEAVGPTGHVTAVDIAPPDYGSPQTLGEATALISNSPIGDRVTFRLRFNALEASAELAAAGFDVVVLALSSWYFSSAQELAHVLDEAIKWTPRLCFAEWDLQPRTVEQLPHFLAVFIQAQIEQGRADSRANVRTPLSRGQMRTMIANTGWTIDAEAVVDSPELQDADWEIAIAKSSFAEAVAAGQIQPWLDTQYSLLLETGAGSGNHSLSCYTLVASR